mgnify:CR=1 FL=1
MVELVVSVDHEGGVEGGRRQFHVFGEGFAIDKPYQDQAAAKIDRYMRGPGGQPLRLNLSTGERASLVAFLGTLTDNTLLTDVRYSNPFGR